MEDIASDTKIHVLRAMPWMDAIIKLLQPRSPYRPWHGAAGAEPGDAVLAILDTDPPSVIAEVREVDADGGADRAIAGCVDPGERGTIRQLFSNSPHSRP